MTARQLKNCEGISRVGKMGARTPEAASSNNPFRPADHTFRPHAADAVVDAAPQAGYRGMTSPDSPPHQENMERRLPPGSHSGGKAVRTPTPTFKVQEMPEQLAEMIATMIPGSEGQDLGQAFRFAADFPPITEKSLSELDIQNIISNIKLRHDINFDRDISFRPKLDGTKGQEKLKAAAQYWKALVAELELYVGLFQGSPSLMNPEQASWSEVVENAKRRIPKIFTTIRGVLKSLTPERDHSRIDEHLDTPMLMQAIEKGVCDLVRLAEWLAHLLKEHCAPMRDEMVDKMVEETKLGVAENNSQHIVNGLRELLGILEAMKLDIANHQIRNLRLLLIEDTVNCERHHHLDKLVTGRTRVKIETAYRWYESALTRYRGLHFSPQRDSMHFHLNIFLRAVVSSLFANSSQLDFPETFYLDHDRLATLKSEIDDLVYIEICFDMFGQLLRDFGFYRSIPHAARHILRTSLSAIIGEGVSHGPSHWMRHSEHITVELVRQALVLSRCPPNYGFEIVQASNQRLRTMFLSRFTQHSSALESYLFPQILASVNRHIYSSPVELFNNLLTTPNAPPPPPPPSHAPAHPFALAPDHTHTHTHNTFPPHPDQFSDLANRIAHIVLLHWRVWGPIAYVLEDQNAAPAPPPLPHAPPPPPAQAPGDGSPAPAAPDAPVVAVMKTGEPPDAGEGARGYAGSSSSSSSSASSSSSSSSSLP